MLCNFPSFISGNSLPYPVEAAAVIGHEDSLMILGGFKGSGYDYNNKIYKYNNDGGQWVEVPTTLSEGKGWLTGIKVKPSFLQSC